MKLCTLLLLFGLLALFNSVAQANDKTSTSDDINGTWEGTYSVGSASVPVQLKFEVHDGKVSGTFKSPHTGDGSITKGTWSGGKVQFTAEFQKHDVIVSQGTLANGTLTGTFESEGHGGQWTMKRTGAAD